MIPLPYKEENLYRWGAFLSVILSITCIVGSFTIFRDINSDSSKMVSQYIELLDKKDRSSGDDLMIRYLTNKLDSNRSDRNFVSGGLAGLFAIFCLLAGFCVYLWHKNTQVPKDKLALLEVRIKEIEKEIKLKKMFDQKLEDGENARTRI